MRRLRRELRWLGLYALIPLSVGLIALDDGAPLTQTWRLILLGGIVVVICVLAVRWSERNYVLMMREGANALVTYRSLPGTIEGVSTKPTVQGPRPNDFGTLSSGYDPLAVPAVSNSRAVEERPL